MATPKLILFDLDGTLVDSVDLIVRSFEQALITVLGSAPTRAEILPWLGRSLDDIMADVDAARADELVAAYREWNHAQHDELIRSIPGATDLVVDCVRAGSQVGVVTSKINWLANRSLQVTGLADLISVTVGADDTDRHKPNPDPILLGLVKHGVDAGRAVYVGDAVVDMQAAQAAGVIGIGVSWGSAGVDELREAGAVMVAETPAELSRYLWSCGG